MVGSKLAAMAAVIGDDDLLLEILLRLGFPAFLVCAALVSKRWLSLVADPAFLRQFHDRNPRDLLGFYVHNSFYSRLLFVPVSKAPELQAAVSRADFGHGHGEPYIQVPVGCQNGRLILRMKDKSSYSDGPLVVRSPLCPTQGVTPILPPPQLHVDWVHDRLQLHIQGAYFDSSNSIVFVDVLHYGTKLSVQGHVLQSGVWGDGFMAQEELPVLSNEIDVEMVAHGNLYMVTENGYIHRLDYGSRPPRFFTIKVPNEVGENYYQLSSADDDGGFFLIHREGFQLSVWHHHETGDKREGNWELADTFCVRAAQDRCEEIWLVGVGDNAEFVFLGLPASKAIICVNLRSRTETVYDVTTVGLFCFVSAVPFMTVWPPIFPALSDGE